MNYAKTSLELERNIIDYFNTHKDNRVLVISKHFNVGSSIVQRVLDNHFKEKSLVSK